MSPPAYANGRGPRGPRTPRACDPCRWKKIKCDGHLPCKGCKRRSTQCVYQTPNDGSVWQSTLSTKRSSMPPASLPKSSPPGTLLSDSAHIDHSTTNDSFCTQDRILNSTAHFVESFTPSPSHDGDLSALGSTRRSANDCSHGEPGEIVGTNTYNNNVEFYGSNSSVSFLLLAEKNHGNGSTVATQSIVSSLHNPATDPDEQDCLATMGSPEKTYEFFPEAAQRFIDGYFDGLHYAQPILEKKAFLDRCQDLWRSGRESCSTSFLALYYSVISLGALTMVWDSDELIDGKGRLEWSRMLLNIARNLAGTLCQTTDLEAVQSFFFIAKVCQNELSPHSAYLWAGRAIRVALAMGLNRNPMMASTSAEGFELYQAQSRTWWLLYCLEVEISFFLGRPDSLGDDCYHNRLFPGHRPRTGVDDLEGISERPEIEIIPLLARLFQICRSIPTKLYNPSTDLFTKVQNLEDLEHKLDSWLATVPRKIRPSKHSASAASLDLNSELSYIRKQRLVLGTKYYSARTLMHATFIGQVASPGLMHKVAGSIQSCAESASLTINLIYESYCYNFFFRTWWFNMTYTTFAATILLFHADQTGDLMERTRYQELVQHAIDILQVMDENIVARKANSILNRCLDRLRHGFSSHISADSSWGIQPDLSVQGDGMQLPNAFPFDLSTWDGLTIFPWADFGTNGFGGDVGMP